VVLACLDDVDAHRPEGVSYSESLPCWLPAAGFAAQDRGQVPDR
jgi:hypothetical protein